MKVRLLTVVAVLLAAPAARPADEDKTIAEAVAASKDHTILLAGLREAGLYDTLKGKGPYTLFAPTDAAFRKLGDDTLRKLVADKALLRKLILAHVVEGKELSTQQVAALDGQDLNGFRVSAKGGLRIGDAKVTAGDQKCGNGVMHAVDAVLVPGK
jgi:uncharacterized surface protein with fasciclin (FAS1) repeats